MGALRKAAIGCGGLGVLLAIGSAGLVGYGVATFDRNFSFRETPYPEVTASADPAVIERGRYLVTGPGHCSSCHAGTADRAHPERLTQDAPLSGGFEFAMGPIATVWAANLTSDEATGIGRFTDRELARAIRHGVLPDGRLSIFMAVSASKPSDDDLVAIISYLRSLPPVDRAVKPAEAGLLLKVMMPFVAFGPSAKPAPSHVPAGAEPTVERGSYLANSVALCVGCHSHYDTDTFQPVEPLAGGGVPDPSHGSDTDKEFCAPNLTSDRTGVTGQLDEDAFVARMRRGRVYASSIMPWENFAWTDEADLRSVYRYLKSLPPVANDVGPSYRDVGWEPPT